MPVSKEVICYNSDGADIEVTVYSETGKFDDADLRKAIKPSWDPDEQSKIIIYKWDAARVGEPIVDCDDLVHTHGDKFAYELPSYTMRTETKARTESSSPTAQGRKRIRADDLGQRTLPVVVPPTHRPRFVNAVKEKWAEVAKRIKDNEKVDLRNGWIMQFSGESGAGKTRSALNDTVLALQELGVTDIGELDIKLTGDDYEKFKGFEGALSAEEKDERNRKAREWCEKQLQCRPATNEVILFVVDEFQVSIPLCRGLCAELQTLMDNFYRDDRRYIFLVFAGLSRADVSNNSNTTASVSTDGSKVHQQHVRSWPSLPDCSDLDVAAQFVQLRRRRVDSQDSTNSNYDDRFTAAKLESEPVVELLRMAGGNMAAIDHIAEELKAEDLKGFTREQAETLHNSTVQHLLDRNSNKVNKWLELKSPLRPIAEKLFDAAVLGSVPRKIAEELSKWGLVTFTETANDPTEMAVIVNGYYWAVLVQANKQWHPRPFTVTSDDFEKLGMEWLRCRAVAFQRLLQKETVPFQEFIPGCRLLGSVTLPKFNQILKEVSTATDKIERDEPTEVRMGLSVAFNLTPPLFFVNGPQAECADGICLLNELTVWLQAKLSANQIAGCGPLPNLTATVILHEREKAGFPITVPDTKFDGQRSLHKHLSRRTNSIIATSVFIVFSHKSAKGVDESALPSDTVLISQETFEERVGAFAKIAYRLVPDKSSTANKPANKEPKASAKKHAKPPAKKTKKTKK